MSGRIETGLAANGALRWVAADVTGASEEARRRHDLSPVAAAALGRALTGALLLSRLAPRRPDRLTLEIRGDGPLRSVVAEVDPQGNLRGLVGEAQVDVPSRADGKLAVGAAVGAGTLRVARWIDGESHSSQVRLVSGEIGEDLAHFLDQSEQTRSAVLVGVLTRPAGVAAAGGLIVEALADAPEGVLDRLQANIEAVSGVSRAIEEGGIEALRDLVLRGLEARTIAVDANRFSCGCSRERLRAQLRTLSAEDLDYLQDEEGRIDAECAYCATVYRYQVDQLRSAADA